MILNNVYFKSPDNTDCFGYKLHADLPTWKTRYIPENHFVVCDIIESKLSNNFSLINSNLDVPKGSNIHLATQSKFAIADIRRNYNVKRSPDSADFIVFPEFNLRRVTWINSGTIVWDETTRVAVSYDGNKSFDDMWLYATQFVPNFKKETMRYGKASICFNIYRDVSAWRTLLDGTITKPCVLDTQLDLSSENELTVDLLTIVMKTAQVYWREADAEKNLTIQLNVLNQHDWRSYPGTLSLLKRMIGDHTGCIYNQMRRTSSRFPKTIKPFLEYSAGGKFSSERDFKMAQAFVESIINVGECRYVSVTDIINKCIENHIPLEVFGELYKNIVKITPAEYINA